MILDNLDISKIIKKINFKNKIYYYLNIILNKKYFKKQSTLKKNEL
jgi:hypothetical protein